MAMRQAAWRATVQLRASPLATATHVGRSVRVMAAPSVSMSASSFGFAHERRCFSSEPAVASGSATASALDHLDETTTLLFADGQLTDSASGVAGSSDTWALIQGVQSVIETIHTTTGLPWWATLAATGVTFRAVVFPLYVYQIKATQRLMQAKSDFSKLYSAYKYARTFLPGHDHKGHIDAILLGRKGIKLVMKKYETRPVQTVLGSLVHVPLFILMAYSARDMIRSGNFQGLETGGFLYWTNLKECDETYLLPMLACGSTYWNIELAMKNKSQIWTQLGQGIQFIPLLAFPMMSFLPQGVFFYWLGSSWSSMAQTIAMNNNSFRRRLGLQPRITAPENRLAAAAAAAAAVEGGQMAENDHSSANAAPSSSSGDTQRENPTTSKTA